MSEWLSEDWVVTWLLPGLGAALFALFAEYRERRRRMRRNPDKVGIVPWHQLSIVATFVTVVFLLMAIVGWLRS